MRESADDNFEFDENSRKFCKRVLNTVGKGEIAGYEKFPPFPIVFSKRLFPGASKGVIVWEWVNTSASALTAASILYTDRDMDRLTHGWTFLQDGILGLS